MGRIIQPIGDKIIIPKLKRKPFRKMWMGLEDHFPPRPLNPRLSKMSILTSGSVQGGSSSPPAGGYSDTFTGANGTTINAHDANWDLGAVEDGDIDSLTIQSNAINVAAWVVIGVYYNASSSDTSQIVLLADQTQILIGCAAVRMSVGNSGYSFGFYAASGGNWTGVQYAKDGVAFGAGIAGSWAQNANHTLKLVASGTGTVTLTGSVDGTPVTSTNDSSSPYNTGKPGFWSYNASTGSAYTCIDDWQDY